MRPPPNIVLRNVEEADLAIHYSFQQEQAGYQMAAVVPRTEAIFFQHWRENVLGNRDVEIKTIVWNDEVVGDVTSFVQDGVRLVGYWLGQKYWGLGIATAAVSQFLERHERRRPLYAFVAVTNQASYRVLQKCGFQQVGTPALASDGIEEFKLELVR